jgi:serine protease AprX
MKRLFTSAILLTLLSMAFGQTTKDWRQKIDASLLEKTANGQSVPFLIVLAQQADLTAALQLKTKNEKASFVFNKLRQTAISTQAGLSAFLNQKNAKYESIFIVNAIKTEGNLVLINSLAQRSDVAHIMDNPNMRYAEPVERMQNGVGERVLIEWGIDMINANDVWEMGYRGEGVTVGGQDTGYDWTHPALQSKYRGFDAATQTADHNYNWHDAIHVISPLSADSLNPCGINLQAPCDDNSHGTHTMGTMVGSEGENEIGVAPDAKWCACRNMERGNGSPFTYLECFQWFVAPTDLNGENPDPTKAPHVINNSWYCSTQEGCNPTNFLVMSQAVTNLKLAGTLVVVSAGNAGSSCETVLNPAIFESSFTVGATAINDTIAGFSSRGPATLDGSNRLKPNVSAPGVGVRSSIPNGGYAGFSGTSMAGPHVAGLVALVISANPELAGQVDVIEDIIEQTAIPKTTDQNCGDIPGTQVPNHTYGFGRVDALAAVEAAIALIPPPPPSATNEETRLSVSVYPNPIDNQLFFEIKNALGEVQVQLLDINGKLIIARNWSVGNHSKMSLDLTGKLTGVYFYRIINGREIRQGKVVKD